MITSLITLQLNESFHVESHSKDLIASWILTMILKLGGHKEFIDDRRMSYDDLISFFSLNDYEEDYEKEDRTPILGALEALKSQLDAIEPKSTSPLLEKNIQKLCAIVELNDIEIDVLRFCIYLHYYDLLENAGRLLGDLTTDKFEYVLSVILNYPRSAIREVFSSRSTLAKNSIIAIDRGTSRALRNKVDIATGGFADKMMSSDEEIEEMIRDVVKKCDPSSLQLGDYNHVQDALDVLIPYLNNAIESRDLGSNILLYGLPGTGKTELVKTIASHFDIPLYEVSYEDDDQDPIEGTRRLKAYRTAQSLFLKKRVMLMFDEIEDVISSETTNPFSGTRKRQSNKAWINRMLETNPIPTIWITNAVHAMDDAIIRRFDIALEITIPPKKKRKEIILNHVGTEINENVIDAIAANEHIAPAIIARAAKVVQSINSTEPSKAFQLIVENTLKAQGYRGLEKEGAIELPLTYDPSYVNTEHNLVELVAGIAEYQSARICLYGAPGTGKSAFGQWIARELDRPFLLKKGSDLMSMWVGGTEKNIASAFKEAMEENAVLVFDEVDSFLQDRRAAKASWEVTQVNEMLVQMENYTGIFIATTNLMDGLDQASLRRFDLKLEFGYLKPKQALELFTKEAVLMGFEEIHDSLQRDVRSLGALTPGDFAAVRRQSRFAPIKTADDLFERLQDEVAIKEEGKEKKMGFLK